MLKLYTLLHENYVEDDDSMFLEFLLWTLQCLAGFPNDTIGFEWSQIVNWLGLSEPS